MITEEKKNNIKQALLEHIKYNIYNETSREYNNNIICYKHKKDNGFGVINKGGLIKLPDLNTEYSLISMSLNDVSGLINTTNTDSRCLHNEWINLSDYCNDNNIVIDVFDSNSLYIHKRLLYIKTSLNTNTLYIAIKSKLARNLNYDINKVTINIYKDSSVDITYVSLNYFKYDFDISELDEILEGYDDRVVLYVNGYYCLYEDINEDVKFIDVISNKSVLIKYSYNIEELPIYINNEGKERVLLHLPKIYNNNQFTYTFNTIDIFVTNTKGIKFLNSETEPINQITFSDISIDKNTLDSYMNKLGISSGNIDVRFRRYENRNLTTNRTLTKLLYEHFTDDEIIDFLIEGYDNDTIKDIWGAKYLEESEAVFSFSRFPKIKDDFLHKAIKTLGFYETLNVINATTQQHNFENNNTTFVFNKSTAFKGEVLYPLIFLNSKRTHLTYSQDDDTVTIQGLPFETDDNLRILNLPGTRILYPSMFPIIGASDLSIGYGELGSDLCGLRLFEYTSISGDVLTSDNIIVTNSSIEIDIDNTDLFTYVLDENGYEFSFNSIANDRHFFVIPEGHYSFRITETFDYDEIDDNKLSFILDINGIPPFDIPNQYVFLNNNLLIKDIDYRLVKLENTNGSMSGYELILTNINHLNNLISNDLEIIITSTLSDSYITQKGYVLNNVISCDNKLDTDIDYSLIGVGGDVIGNNRYAKRDSVLSVDALEESSPFLIAFPYSNAIYDYIKEVYIENNIDKDRTNLEFIKHFVVDNLDIITNLMNYVENNEINNPNNHELIQLGTLCNNGTPSEKINIISIYISIILDDIINETINLTTFSDEEIATALESYEYLEKFEIFHNENELNGRFVNLQESYDMSKLDSLTEDELKIITYIKTNKIISF